MSPDLLAELLRPTPATHQRFVAEWHGARPPRARVPGDELPAWLPATLSEFYELAYRWEQAVVFNALVDPAGLSPDEDGNVVFCAENQGVVLWAVEPGTDDPPVFIAENVEPAPLEWQAESERLSSFLLQLVLFEAMIGAPSVVACAYGVEDEIASTILAPLSPLPLPAWRWPAEGSTFWVGDDLVARVCAGPSGTDIDIGARTARAARYLGALPSDAWLSPLTIDDGG